MQAVRKCKPSCLWTRLRNSYFEDSFTFFLTSDNSDDHSVRNCSISRTGRVTWNLAHWWVGFCVRDMHLTLTQILSSLTNLWKPKLIAELAKMPRCLTLAREAPSFSSWELSTLQLDCFCITCPAGLSLLQQKVRSINHVHPFELEQQRTVRRRSLNLSFLHHHSEEKRKWLNLNKKTTHHPPHTTTKQQKNKKTHFTLIISCLGLIIQITCVITTFQNFYVLQSASLRSVSAPIHQKKKKPHKTTTLNIRDSKLYPHFALLCPRAEKEFELLISPLFC